MATVAESLKPGLTALTDFSSTLTRAFEGIDDNVGFLRQSLDDALRKLQALQVALNQHEHRLKIVESETVGQKENVESAMKLAASVEKTVGTQLNDATKNLHKEMLTQRTLNKMDIGSLRSKLEDSLEEAMSMITDHPKYVRKSLPVFNPNFNTEESIKFLVDRINNIDDAMERQGNFNEKLSSVVGHEDALQQQLIGQLNNEVDQLQNALTQSQTVNSDLLKTIDDLQSITKRQEDQLDEVLHALTYKDKLKDLRSEVRSRPSSSGKYLKDEQSSDSHDGRRGSSAKRTSIKKTNDEQEIAEGDEVGDEEPSSFPKDNEVIKKRTKSRTNRRLPTSKSAKQKQSRKGSLEQVVEDDGVEAGEEEEAELSAEEEDYEETEKEAEEEFQEQLAEAKAERARAKAEAAAAKKLAKEEEKQRKQREKQLVNEKRQQEAEERKKQRQQQLDRERTDLEGGELMDDEEADVGDEEEQNKEEEGEAVVSSSSKKRVTSGTKSIRKPSPIISTIASEDPNAVQETEDSDIQEMPSKKPLSGRRSAESKKAPKSDDEIGVEKVRSGPSSRAGSKPASANRSASTASSPSHRKTPTVNQRQASSKWLPFNSTDESALSEKDKALLASIEGVDFLNPEHPNAKVEKETASGDKKHKKKGHDSDEELDDQEDEDDEDSDEYERRRRRRRRRHRQHRKKHDNDSEDEDEDGDKHHAHHRHHHQAGNQQQGDPTTDETEGGVPTDKVYSQLFDDNDTLFTPSVDSGSHYKEDSEGSESGSDHGEWIHAIEETQEEQGTSLRHLRQECDERLGQLETQLNTFKRIVFAIEDLKINYDSLKKKVDGAHITENNLEEKLQQAMMNRITRLKEMWTKIHFELIFALDNAEEHDGGGGGNSAPSSSKPQTAGHHAPGHHTPSSSKGLSDMMNTELHSFFQKARDLSHILENGLDFFHLQDNLEKTLEKLFPSLEKIHANSDVLLKMDDEARKSASLDYSFDDLLCSDLTPSLRSLITEAQKETVPVLDECIAKIFLYRKIHKLQEKLEKKVDTSVMMDMEYETRRLLSNKVDQNEFMTITSKFASSAELQRMHVLVSDLTGGNGSLGGASGGGRMSEEEFYRRSLVDHPDFQSILERFQSLVNKQFDLEQNQDKLISKEEIQEALKAIVNEVKNLRKNSVTTNIFKEGLKGKADVQEVEK